MSTSRPPPGSIPTLTEVVTWPAAPSPAAPAAAPARQVDLPPPAPTPAPALPPPPSPASVAATPAVPAAASVPPPAAPPVDEAKLAERILQDVQRQVDLALEVRLREALAPLLARASDALVRDARKELTAAMGDIVARSVARVLGGDRKR